MRKAFPLFLGLLLVIFGALAAAFGGIPYSERKKLELGPLETSLQMKKSLPIPPIVAWPALIAGVGLVFYGAYRK